MTQQTLESDLVIWHDVVLVHIFDYGIDDILEYLWLEQAACMIHNVMCSSGIKTAYSSAVFHSHGILSFVTVTRGTLTADKRQELRLEFSYASEGIADKAVFDAAFFFVGHMPETASAAEFADRAIRLYAMGRSCCKAFYTAIAI